MRVSRKEIYGAEYFSFQHSRSQIRKFIRKFYLRNIANYCLNSTIDFGCGIGALLKILPEGSIGYEINKVAVEYCKSIGLNVHQYNLTADDYAFKMVENPGFTAFTMNHVLEHLENPSEVMEKIFQSCFRLNITRIVFTVPGAKGYKYDVTHRTYVDFKYLEQNDLLVNPYYSLSVCKYFPVNWAYFSRFFTHNELRLVFERK